MSHTKTFELVLYFNRRAVAKPYEPVIENLVEVNSDMVMDDILDLYSDLKNKYKEDMKKYEKNKNDSVVTDFVRILEDKSFIENVKKIEKETYFIEWDKNSKKLIDNTFLKLLK